MIIQHNMQAANANRMLGNVVTSQAKSTEKLSSGYRINRAADDAAGLSISEKMRSQIRGLNQASTNAQDGISLIQTAEGALSESHSILQRMKELSVQASNGTETDVDRQAVQDEISALQEELTRISTDTEFNTMKLLDGSLDNGGGSSTSAGPKFGVIATNLDGALISSNLAGVELKVTSSSAVKAGSETAIWNDDGTELTLNVVAGKTYTQAEIDDLIVNAKQENASGTGSPSQAPAEITVKLNNGVLSVSTGDTTIASGSTVAGKKATDGATIANSYIGVNQVTFTSNRYGKELNGTAFSIVFDGVDGKENVETKKEISYSSANTPQTGSYVLHLAAGKEYTEEDIEDLLAKAGFDINVNFGSTTNPDEPNTLFAMGTGANFDITMADGDGLGSAQALLGQTGYDGLSSGEGITLQVGANEGQTISFTIADMSARALGVDNNKIDLSTQEKAEKAITVIDKAIQKVSTQRGAMGAIQNRLEHTIANLDNTAENLQSAESTIRDVDMAKEMVTYSKNNILQQAAQSMLAQANQSSQGVLSLLQ